MKKLLTTMKIPSRIMHSRISILLLAFYRLCCISEHLFSSKEDEIESAASAYTTLKLRRILCKINKLITSLFPLLPFSHIHLSMSYAFS